MADTQKTNDKKPAGKKTSTATTKKTTKVAATTKTKAKSTTKTPAAKVAVVAKKVATKTTGKKKLTAKKTTRKNITDTMPTAAEVSEQVAKYLAHNLDFFKDHTELLECMEIPHESGGASSLLIKQLELLRKKEKEHHDNLCKLIEIAEQNHLALDNMHQLALGMLEADSTREVLDNMTTVFRDYFQTECEAFFIIKDIGGDNNAMFVSPNNNKLRQFDKILSEGKPSCGKITLGQAQFLFGDKHASKVQSCAIVPMLFTELEGMLAIGSYQSERFHHGVGDVFLVKLGELIGTRLISLYGRQYH